MSTEENEGHRHGYPLDRDVSKIRDRWSKGGTCANQRRNCDHTVTDKTVNPASTMGALLLLPSKTPRVERVQGESIDNIYQPVR